jgi:hypothetical protein
VAEERTDHAVQRRRSTFGTPQVPPQDRGRGDDPMQSASRGQQPGQCRKHRPIRPRQARSVHLTAQHGDLVAQHEDFRVFRLCAAGQQPEPGQDLPEDQIQQSYRHDRRSCPTTTVPRYPQLTAVDGQFGTHPHPIEKSQGLVPINWMLKRGQDSRAVDTRHPLWLTGHCHRHGCCRSTAVGIGSGALHSHRFVGHDTFL